jgi:hypothetical protein
MQFVFPSEKDCLDLRAFVFLVPCMLLTVMFSVYRLIEVFACRRSAATTAGKNRLAHDRSCPGLITTVTKQGPSQFDVFRPNSRQSCTPHARIRKKGIDT